MLGKKIFCLLPTEPVEGRLHEDLLQLQGRLTRHQHHEALMVAGGEGAAKPAHQPVDIHYQGLIRGLVGLMFEINQQYHKHQPKSTVKK